MKVFLQTNVKVSHALETVPCVHRFAGNRQEKTFIYCHVRYLGKSLCSLENNRKDM